MIEYISHQSEGLIATNESFYKVLHNVLQKFISLFFLSPMFWLLALYTAHTLSFVVLGKAQQIILYMNYYLGESVNSFIVP